jgi:putative tricarboxylic transport membrane protein
MPVRPASAPEGGKETAVSSRQDKYLMPTKRLDIPALVIAILLLVAAGVIWRDLSSLQINSVYGIGPKAMPGLVAIGLGILGVANVVNAFRGALPERESLQWSPIILILGGLAALIAIIAVGGGFIIATAILFTATSAAFGRTAYVTDLIIGLVIAVVIYLVFSKLLSLTLPVGPLERLM